MCSTFKLGQDNPSQKAGFVFCKAKVVHTVERSVRDFQSGQKSGKRMLISKYTIDLDFPLIRIFCFQVGGKIFSCCSKIMYFKSERSKCAGMCWCSHLLRGLIQEEHLSPKAPHQVKEHSKTTSLINNLINKHIK